MTFVNAICTLLETNEIRFYDEVLGTSINSKLITQHIRAYSIEVSHEFATGQSLIGSVNTPFNGGYITNLNSEQVLPLTVLSDIGTNTNRWRKAYAVSFEGNGTSNLTTLNCTTFGNSQNRVSNAWIINLNVTSGDINTLSTGDIVSGKSTSMIGSSTNRFHQIYAATLDCTNLRLSYIPMNYDGGLTGTSTVNNWGLGKSLDLDPGVYQINACSGGGGSAVAAVCITKAQITGYVWTFNLNQAHILAADNAIYTGSLNIAASASTVIRLTSTTTIYVYGCYASASSWYKMSVMQLSL